MNVISFFLWGKDRSYLSGAEKNAKLAAEIYPGWSLRCYCEPHWIEDIQKIGYEAVPRKITIGPWEGLFWRFEPAIDPTVDRFISRDLDSRLNPREKAAVDEWISSGKFLHSMRDAPNHDVPILGGMWGCGYWPILRGLMRSWTVFDHKGCDQEFLASLVWPRLFENAMIHDSFRQDPRIKPFPPHPPMDPNVHGTFVGQIMPP